MTIFDIGADANLINSDFDKCLGLKGKIEKCFLKAVSEEYKEVTTLKHTIWPVNLSGENHNIDAIEIQVITTLPKELEVHHLVESCPSEVTMRLGRSLDILVGLPSQDLHIITSIGWGTLRMKSMVFRCRWVVTGRIPATP